LNDFSGSTILPASLALPLIGLGLGLGLQHLSVEMIRIIRGNVHQMLDNLLA
jgi:hypothetical protein